MTSRGHAVICSPVLPEFDRESGSRRLFHHVQMLRQGGWRVSYVTENPSREERYVRALEQSGCPVYLGFDPKVDALFSLGHVDVAIVAFWYLAEQQMRRIRSLSSTTRIVIDSVDLHFLREARRLLGRDLSQARRSPLNAQYADEFVREMTAYARADAVMTVSQKEADVINDFLGTNRAFHVGDAEAIEPASVPFRDRRGLLFVGNFRHRPNQDAVEYLFGDIVPKLDQRTLVRHPLTIVGNGLSEKIRSLAEGHEHVRMIGWVPSLAPYYARARVCLVPLTYGAGTKRKVIEALMSGVPTVSTSVGIEGLEVADGEHVLVANDPVEFAGAVERLAADSRLWRRLSTNGAAAMAESHGWSRSQAQLVSVLERVGNQPEQRAIWATTTTPMSAYESAVADLTRWLRDTLPGDASVAVASKGDDNLLALGGRRVTHLPADGSGGYAGYHPASSADLLREIASWTSRGGDHLVIPATSSWWLEHYSQFSSALGKNWVNLCAPPELGHVFRYQFSRDDVDFQCNICGALNRVQRALIDREMASCQACMSTPRSRAVIDALTTRLLGDAAVLSQLPVRKDLKGMGLSDWEGYAQVLSARFDYLNTFFRSEPVLDIASQPSGTTGDLDFLVASEVFDHVVGDVETIFANVRCLLKPRGLLVFTVPYALEGATVEYEGASDPSSPTAGFVPARQFSLESLLYVLDRAGYKEVVVHEDINRDFGIWWNPRVSLPLSARAD
jgi:glycosyltransferase involved in cell wall biosynthesis